MVEREGGRQGLVDAIGAPVTVIRAQIGNGRKVADIRQSEKDHDRETRSLGTALIRHTWKVICDVYADYVTANSYRRHIFCYQSSPLKKNLQPVFELESAWYHNISADSLYNKDGSNRCQPTTTWLLV